MSNVYVLLMVEYYMLWKFCHTYCESNGRFVQFT